MHDVIVIGGGPAGVTAALRARELGSSVALIERDRLGGTCTNDGCAPTRVLARAARLIRNSDQFEDYGLMGEAPQVDYAELVQRTQHIIYRIHEKKQLIQHLENSGVEVYTEAGEASFISPHRVRLADGSKLEAQKFILCVGGRPRRLNIPGGELGLTHSDIWSLKTLPRSMAIVGAAATGCQLASIFEAFGSEIWLMDIAPNILPGEDEDLSRVMEDAFRNHGIHLRTGVEAIKSLEASDGGLTLNFSDESVEESLEVEAVIFAVGWIGNLESLNLEAAGVEIERGAIPVDDYLRSSAPHIFAAGDVTGRMMLVQSASYDARVAAENAILGKNTAYEHRIAPHGGFTDPEYASVGLTESQAEEDKVLVTEVAFGELDRAVIDGRTEGFCKLIVSKEDHQIVGAHVVGEQAVEIVSIVAASMAGGMGIEELAKVELAYPTYTAIVGLAARRLVHELGEIELAAEWRELGRPLAAEWERSGGQ